MRKEPVKANNRSNQSSNETGSYSRSTRSIGKPVLIAAILTVAIIFIAISFAPAQSQQVATHDNLPDTYKFDPNIEAAYLFVVDHQSQAMYMACFCHCVNYQHGSLKECFIKKNGSWEGHGVDCEICVDIALDFKSLLANGTTLIDARNILDARYQSDGPSTNTPFPSS